MDCSNPNVEVYLQRVWGNHNVNEDICIPMFIEVQFFISSADYCHIITIADKYHGLVLNIQYILKYVICCLTYSIVYDIGVK